MAKRLKCGCISVNRLIANLIKPTAECTTERILIIGQYLMQL